MKKTAILPFCLIVFSHVSAQMGNFFPSDRFSTIFRKHFGVTPSEYAEQK